MREKSLDQNNKRQYLWQYITFFFLPLKGRKQNIIKNILSNEKTAENTIKQCLKQHSAYHLLLLKNSVILKHWRRTRKFFEQSHWVIDHDTKLLKFPLS